MMSCRYLLAAILACGPLASQAAETAYTFDSVAGVEHRYNEIRITGVLVNDTTPTTVTLPWGSSSLYERCDRLFNIVLSLPGVYNLTVVTETRVVPDPTIPSLVFNRCSSMSKS